MSSQWSDEERLLRYFNYVEKIIRGMKLRVPQQLKAQVEMVVDNAKRYYYDAKHYMSLGDYPTSYVCIAYCEGLLDTLKFLNFIEVIEEGRVVAEKRKRVMVAGVFDIIHPGHIYLISKAAELGDVVVVVARDSTVERLKGRRPVVPEDQRLEVVKNIKGVSEAVLGNEGEDMLKIVEELKPDVILLGPDQNFDEEKLRKDLELRGLKVEVLRLREIYEPYKLCSTSKIIKEILVREDLRKLINY
ncbi:MAG: cytidylyltransferase family protein [Candidatus Nezhaarchaeota archaeon]|nr:cytidylyltransferase family protein [Candidatus Nezhaarchaeota archaeon]